MRHGLRRATIVLGCLVFSVASSAAPDAMSKRVAPGAKAFEFAHSCADPSCTDQHSATDDLRAEECCSDVEAPPDRDCSSGDEMAAADGQKHKRAAGAGTWPTPTDNRNARMATATSSLMLPPSLQDGADSSLQVPEEHEEGSVSGGLFIGGSEAAPTQKDDAQAASVPAQGALKSGKKACRFRSF